MSPHAKLLQQHSPAPSLTKLFCLDCQTAEMVMDAWLAESRKMHLRFCTESTIHCPLICKPAGAMLQALSWGMPKEGCSMYQDALPPLTATDGQLESPQGHAGGERMKEGYSA